MNDREFAAKMRERRGEPKKQPPWPERVASSVDDSIQLYVFQLMEYLQKEGYGAPDQIVMPPMGGSNPVHFLWGSTILTVREDSPRFHISDEGGSYETSDLSKALGYLTSVIPR